jgi:hypothetical protein
MELAAGAITYLCESFSILSPNFREERAERVVASKVTNILNEHKEKSGRHENKSRFKKFLISACVSVVTKFLKDKVSWITELPIDVTDTYYYLSCPVGTGIGIARSG